MLQSVRRRPTSLAGAVLESAHVAVELSSMEHSGQLQRVAKVLGCDGTHRGCSRNRWVADPGSFFGDSLVGSTYSFGSGCGSVGGICLVHSALALDNTSKTVDRDTAKTADRSWLGNIFHAATATAVAASRLRWYSSNPGDTVPCRGQESGSKDNRRRIGEAGKHRATCTRAVRPANAAPNA